MLCEVTVRPVCLPADSAFLLSVYAATRTPELSTFGWSQAQADTFVRIQFDAQTNDYRARFPRASHLVIAVDDRPAGRLIVDRLDKQIRIVDIALLPEFRGAGVGGTLVQRLIDEADAAGLPLRCHVVQGSEARGFWEHLGLVARGVDGVHVAMERECATSRR